MHVKQQEKWGKKCTRLRYNNEKRVNGIVTPRYASNKTSVGYVKGGGQRIVLQYNTEGVGCESTNMQNSTCELIVRH